MEAARLGPYRLLAELGSGGMGRIYRAEVTLPVPGLEPGRAVARKVIHAHLLENVRLNREIMEAWAAHGERGVEPPGDPGRLDPQG